MKYVVLMLAFLGVPSLLVCSDAGKTAVAAAGGASDAESIRYWQVLRDRSVSEVECPLGFLESGEGAEFLVEVAKRLPGGEVLYRNFLDATEGAIKVVDTHGLRSILDSLALTGVDMRHRPRLRRWLATWFAFLNSAQRVQLNDQSIDLSGFRGWQILCAEIGWAIEKNIISQEKGAEIFSVMKGACAEYEGLELELIGESFWWFGMRRNLVFDQYGNPLRDVSAEQVKQFNTASFWSEMSECNRSIVASIVNDIAPERSPTAWAGRRVLIHVGAAVMNYENALKRDRAHRDTSFLMLQDKTYGAMATSVASGEVRAVQEYVGDKWPSVLKRITDFCRGA